KDVRNGAMNPAHTMKTPTERSDSNTRGPAPAKYRTLPAASIASAQFVRNTASTSEVGNRPKRNATCAGKAAARESGHRRGALSSRVAVRIAFGGHTTDGVRASNLRAPPTWAPT